MKLLGNISDWFRNHKVLGLSIAFIIVGVFAVILYTSLRTTSDRAISQGKNELNNQTETVENVIKKESKDLDFSVPMVEEILDAITKQEELDGELTRSQLDAFILEEYSEEVALVAADGLLPSKNLTAEQNKQQLDSIKRTVSDSYAVVDGAWVLDTSEFLFDDGPIVAYPRQVDLTEGYTLEKQGQFFNVGDYSIGGLHVNTTNLQQNYGITYDGYPEMITVAGAKAVYDSLEITSDYFNALSTDENVTVVSYFVRTIENKPSEEMLLDVLDIDLAINEAETLAITDVDKESTIYNPFFGDVSQAAITELESQSSSVFLVRQFISGNALKESNNKLSIQGTEYNLKKVGSNDAIDLTNTYAE